VIAAGEGRSKARTALSRANVGRNPALLALASRQSRSANPGLTSHPDSSNHPPTAQISEKTRPMAYLSTTDSTEAAKTSWPSRVMGGALLLSLFASAFVLPTPVGLELVRDILYAAFVALFLARWRLAVVRHEQSRGWCLYFVLILLAPLIIFLSEPILKAL